MHGGYTETACRAISVLLILLYIICDKESPFRGEPHPPNLMPTRFNLLHEMSRIMIWFFACEDDHKREVRWGCYICCGPNLWDWELHLMWTRLSYVPTWKFPRSMCVERRRKGGIVWIHVRRTFLNKRIRHMIGSEQFVKQHKNTTRAYWERPRCRHDRARVLTRNGHVVIHFCFIRKGAFCLITAVHFLDSMKWYEQQTRWKHELLAVL